MRPLHVAAVGVLLLLAAGSAAAIVAGIGPHDIERAIDLGRQPDAERARFHQRYVTALRDPTGDRVEVITELRRVVLATEDRMRFGDRLFGVREADAILRPWRNRVSVEAHLRFHPQNAYVSVPAYDIVLSGGGETPLDVRRRPVYATPGGPGTHLVGAVIEGVFDAAPLLKARRRVMVRLEGKDLAAVSVDFSAID